MVRKGLAFIGFALLFVSCMNGGTNSNVKQYKLDNYQVLNEYDFDTIGTIRDAIIYQKNIIITADNSNSCFHIIDTGSGNLIKSWGHEGRGPGEYIRIGRQLSINDSSLYFSDNGRKTLHSIPIDVLLSSGNEQNDGVNYPYTEVFRPTKFLALKDYVICLGAIKDMRFGLLDYKTGRIIPHDNYYMPHSEFIEGIYVGSVYQSIMQSNPLGNSFVISLLSSDYFEIFNIDNNHVHRVYEHKDATMPQVHIKAKIGTEYTIDYDKSLAGNVNVTTTKDKIYFLYSDVSYSEYSEKDEANYIKVYDWNGKHLEDLVLPFAVSRIIATENLLYCIKQDVDKVVIHTFGLDNMA